MAGNGAPSSLLDAIQEVPNFNQNVFNVRSELVTIKNELSKIFSEYLFDLKQCLDLIFDLYKKEEKDKQWKRWYTLLQ